MPMMSDADLLHAVEFARSNPGGSIARLVDEITRLRAEVARLECVEGLKGDVITRYEAENAHLRAEVARLEAGRLGPETVNFIRHEMFLQWNHPEDADEEVDAVIADLDRCYPEEV